MASRLIIPRNCQSLRLSKFRDSFRNLRESFPRAVAEAHQGDFQLPDFITIRSAAELFECFLLWQVFCCVEVHPL